MIFAIYKRDAKDSETRPQRDLFAPHHRVSSKRVIFLPATAPQTRTRPEKAFVISHYELGLDLGDRVHRDTN